MASYNHEKKGKAAGGGCAWGPGANELAYRMDTAGKNPSVGGLL